MYRGSTGLGIIPKNTNFFLVFPWENNKRNKNIDFQTRCNKFSQSTDHSPQTQHPPLKLRKKHTWWLHFELYFAIPDGIFEAYFLSWQYAKHLTPCTLIKILVTTEVVIVMFHLVTKTEFWVLFFFFHLCKKVYLPKEKA